MTEVTGNSDSPDRFDALRRYVPLVIWIIVVLVVIIIPLKIISYGYLPQDDALRHAAKAVSGKPWSEILVLNPVYKIDHEFGWNLLLEKIHQWENWNAESLVIFSVVILFILVGLSGLPWLRRPEAWLFSLFTANVVSLFCARLMLGRPFLVTFAGAITILLMWQKYGAARPKKWMLALATIVFAMSAFFHGAWYLWVLLLGAFVFAGQIRWAISLGICLIAGVFFGSALTGHPFAYPVQAIKLALLAVGMHQSQRTMATELQPFGGDLFAVITFGALIILRQLTKLNPIPLAKNPAFWLIIFGWVLGYRIERFWEDWGWPALMVLIAWDLQLFLESRFAENSFKRLLLTVGVAVTVFLNVTADSNSRWTYNQGKQYLEEKTPHLKGWMPEKGGIFYSVDMFLFYDTFFKNPNGDWHYMLGFEPTWMPRDDFKIFQSIISNGGDARAYAPWVEKMKPADRLVIRGEHGLAPEIPQLEWNYAMNGIWIGRLPRLDTNGAPAVIPAVMTNSIPTANSAK